MNPANPAPGGETRTPAFPNLEEQVTAKVAQVQRIVLEKAGLALSADEIVKVHLLALEPEILARSIVFSLTGNVLDLSEDDDELPEERDAIAPHA